MSVNVLTLEEIRANALAAIRSRFPTRDTSPESLLGKLADSMSGMLWDLHLRVQRADYDAIPQAASSSAALDLWANLLGLSDGGTGYGRRAGTLATGFSGVATGVPLTAIADGSPLIANDGTTSFATTAPFVVGGGGSITVTFAATTAGTGGNLESGDVVSFDPPITSVDATVTITVGVDNGATAAVDSETDAALLTRILARLQNPPKAITRNDLRTLCEAVSTTNGAIDRAYVYPRRSGTGTADIVVTQAGTGAARAPAAALVADVQAAIDADSPGARTITAEDITAYAPTFAAPGSGLTVDVRVTPSSSAYAFDWDSSVGAFTVAAYAAGVVTLDVAAPVEFSDAVTAGKKPRLQIQTTGEVMPQEHRVTAYNPGTFACTLETTPTTAPTVGDNVFAGGNLVQPVALAIRNLADSLGPARTALSAGDGADDPWVSTLYVDQVRWAVLDADDDGTRYVLSLVTAPLINGAAADVEVVDVGIGAPKMHHLEWITVRP